MLAFLFSSTGLTSIAVVAVAGVIGVQTLRLHMADSELASLKVQDAADQKAYKANVKRSSDISSQASAAFSVASAAIPRTFAPIKARIAVNVPPKADSQCVISSDFVSLWDAASQAAAVPSSPG